MFPGLTTKLSESKLASATVIDPKTDLVRITGATDIATIRPHYSGQAGIIFLSPADGAINLLATDNIAVAVTIAQNRVCMLVYSFDNNKWYPGAIS